MDVDGELIPLIAQSQGNPDEASTDTPLSADTPEVRKSAIKSFLSRVLTLQLRGMVMFERITDERTEIPHEPFIDPPRQESTVSVSGTLI